MGDSLTYGFGLPRAQVWTALCAKRTGAELINRAVNGNTTGGMLASLRGELEETKPDAVVLMGGTNDLFYGCDLAGAKSNMGAMVHLALAAGVAPVIAIPPGPCPPIREDWAAWVDSERTWRALAEYGAWLRELCRMFCVSAIDFERALPSRDFYLDDGIHPNRAGQALMAEIAAQVIMRIGRW